MRIGVNALLLGSQSGYRRSGVSRYIDRLVRALPAALNGDDTLTVFVGRDAEASHGPRIGYRRSWWPVERPEARLPWEHLALPLETRRAKIDLFHGTVNVVPRGLRCHSVVTVHDLAFLRWPDQVTRRRHRYLAGELRGSLGRARRIIAVSEATKADLVEMLGVDPSRVAVTPLGVDERFRPVEGDAWEEFREARGIVRPFVLSVGTLEPRKNLPALLRAFATLTREIPHDLVLVGGEGWLTEEIHHTMQTPKLAGRVRLTGFVEDDDLPAWYGAADCFAFPSLYEGFGLPVLEAMASGVPVVTSNLSSLPEVAGDAALLVDPDDVKAIADGIRLVVTDSAFAATLRRAGTERAAEFTWERTAALTATVYREVAG
ncbi:MAG: glycosyltransferase family 4 protein [Thermomicrobiales bacterium]